MLRGGDGLIQVSAAARRHRGEDLAGGGVHHIIGLAELGRAKPASDDDVVIGSTVHGRDVVCDVVDALQDKGRGELRLGTEGLEPKRGTLAKQERRRKHLHKGEKVVSNCQANEMI